VVGGKGRRDNFDGTINTNSSFVTEVCIGINLDPGSVRHGTVTNFPMDRGLIDGVRVWI
jgi:hypothetical protein